MTPTRLVIHGPEHRRRSIATQRDPLAARTYDHNVHAYFDFLRSEARKDGIEIAIDQQDVDAPFSLEGDHAQKRRTHDWFERQPDIWDWLPAADARGAPPPADPQG